jgi:osmotically-inducible protein OsmY
MRRIATRLAGCAFLCVIATHGVAGQTVPVRNSAKPPENGTSNLSREIHHQILVLPFYSVFDSINFTLEGRKVTLTGQVLRRNLKENAEGAMRSIEGVDTVINQIEVLPASPADDDLRRALYRALYEDSTLERYAVQNVPPVRIIVKNGARASAVPKTTGVRNDLVVHAKESASE